MLELLALIEECRRLQRPAMPPILRSALGVPYQLERRLLDELAALK